MTLYCLETHWTILRKKRERPTAGKWVQRGRTTGHPSLFHPLQMAVYPSTHPWGYSGAPHCQWGPGWTQKGPIDSGLSIAALSTLVSIFTQGSKPVCQISTVPGQGQRCSHYFHPSSVSLPVKWNDGSDSPVFMGSSNECVKLKGPGVQLLLFLFCCLATSQSQA